MSNIKNANIPTLSLNKVISYISDALVPVLRANLPAKTVPSIMLWGPPGVGKSQAIRQIAEQVGQRTGKQTRVTDVRLLLFNPIDLRGIPTANADKTLAVWLKPKIFDMVESPSVINFLFLDEISAAPPSVQAAAYQITLDRVVGEHRLPDNCVVVAAGNRVTDKSVAYKMPKALANRLLHIEVQADFEAWREWAVAKGVHPKVLGFLSFRRDYLMCERPAEEDLAFPTPRSWEMVSNLLRAASDDVGAMYPMIAGLVGNGVALEFRSWDKVYRTLPSIPDIFAGRRPPAPTSTDALYALTSAMTAYAREHKTDLTALANSIAYADTLPPDFSAVLLRDYMYLEPDFKTKLMRIPAFAKWLNTKGRLLNGT